MPIWASIMGLWKWDSDSQAIVPTECPYPRSIAGKNICCGCPHLAVLDKRVSDDLTLQAECTRSSHGPVREERGRGKVFGGRRAAILERLKIRSQTSDQAWFHQVYWCVHESASSNRSAMAQPNKGLQPCLGSDAIGRASIACLTLRVPPGSYAPSSEGRSSKLMTLWGLSWAEASMRRTPNATMCITAENGWA